MKELMQKLAQKLAQQIIQYRLNILTVMTFIFPILPLVALSVWGLSFVLISMASGSHSSFNLSSIIWAILILLWMLGGLAGLFGAVFALLKIHTKKTFFLFVYGAVSYSFIAMAYIAASLGQQTLNGFLIASYFSMTLVVVAIQIVRLHEKVVVNDAANDTNDANNANDEAEQGSASFQK